MVPAMVFRTVAAAILAVVTSCHGGSGEEGPARLDASVVLADAPCTIILDSPPLLPASHVAIGTDVMYDSNPPSSGPHYPIWAAFQAYDHPVDRRYYVHDAEHGAVVFLYKCEDGGNCADVAAQLSMAAGAIADDPLCAGTGTRARTVLTPDPLLDVPIAAIAWGWTYRAECFDLPSLTDFARAHYGHGPEVTCAAGDPSL
jgi:hypothetical protein